MGPQLEMGTSFTGPLPPRWVFSGELRILELWGLRLLAFRRRRTDDERWAGQVYPWR